MLPEMSNLKSLDISLNKTYLELSEFLPHMKALRTLHIRFINKENENA